MLAWGEQKMGRSGEGVSEKGKWWGEKESFFLPFPCLTLSPFSLFFTLACSFVPFACFLAMH